MSAPSGARRTASRKDESQKEKEMKELLRKLKEASKVPDHAVRRVKRLDELIKGIRKAQRQVLAQVASDTAKLADLERQERETLARIAPIEASLKEREAIAADLRHRLGLASGGVATFVGDSKDRTIKTKKAEATHRKAITGRDLKASRGYDMTAGSKPHLQVPKGTAFQRSMKAKGQATLGRSAGPVGSRGQGMKAPAGRAPTSKAGFGGLASTSGTGKGGFG